MPERYSSDALLPSPLPPVQVAMPSTASTPSSTATLLCIALGSKSRATIGPYTQEKNIDLFASSYRPSRMVSYQPPWSGFRGNRARSGRFMLVLERQVSGVRRRLPWNACEPSDRGLAGQRSSNSMKPAPAKLEAGDGLHLVDQF